MGAQALFEVNFTEVSAMSKSVVMYPHVVDKDVFSEYIKGPISSIMMMVSGTLKADIETLAKFGAIALGWSSYDDLKYAWRKQDNIRDSIFISRCNHQAGRIVFAAKNIKFVYFEDAYELVGMALRPGEEGRRIEPTDEQIAAGEAVVLKLPVGLQFVGAGGFMHGAGPYSATGLVEYFAEFESSEIGPGLVFFARSENGLEVSVKQKDRFGAYNIVDRVYLPFSSRQFDDSDEDNVLIGEYEPRVPGGVDVQYQWLKTAKDDMGELELAPLDPVDGMSLSSGFFTRPDAAHNCVGGDSIFSEEFLKSQGAVLVKSVRTIVKSAY